MSYNVLVTGGAGFIGSYLVDALVKDGCKVAVLDNLTPQVHRDGKVPSYMNSSINFIRRDVRDRNGLSRALKDAEVVFHHASVVGVGQSMYEIERYVDANSRGTAALLDVLVNEKNSVEKLIVASSMSVYGEGEYLCDRCGRIHPEVRPFEQLRNKEWEMRCDRCGASARPIPTSEDKPLHPTSVYAISKRDQEEMCLILGRAYDIPTVALRYFNVYGRRQSLSNPYTGVAAIFSSRLLNNNPPIIYEDGNQTRDFTHVSDIVQANLLAMQKEAANYQVFNVGTGEAISIKEVAEALGKALGSPVKPQVTYQFREGDIRHCYAEITRIREKLGYQPKVKFEDGMADLAEWVKGQSAEDLFTAAEQKLSSMGLTR